MSIRHKGYFK